MTMAEKTLLIELFQPFAQYRNPFTFYYAQTYPLPPKSTIIGMLQNALDDWYGQREGLEKWWSLKVSVHGGFESVFWNYQQLIKGEISLVRFYGRPILWNQWTTKKEKGKVNQGPVYPNHDLSLKRSPAPVSQQELFNGWLYILLRHENEGFLEKIKNALERPRKVLSLGRSEDVIFIRNVRFINESEVKPDDAIELGIIYPTYVYVKSPFDMLERLEYPTYYLPVKVIFKNGEKPVGHKVEINERTFRDVEFKPVIHVGPWKYLGLKKEIPFEEYRLGKVVLRVPNGKEVSGWL